MTAVALLAFLGLGLFLAGLVAFGGAIRRETKPNRDMQFALLLLQRVEADPYFVALSDPSLREDIQKFNRNRHKELSR